MSTHPGRWSVLRRATTVLAVAGVAFFGAQASSYAASSYSIDQILHNSYCNATNNVDVLFATTAAPDGSSLTDFTGWKQSAHVNLPGGCNIVTKICIQTTVSETVKGDDSVVDTSAPFGDFGDVWDTSNTAIAGPEAVIAGKTCRSVAGLNSILTIHEGSDDSLFVYGGTYNLKSYEIESRASWTVSGSSTLHYGGWDTYTKSL